MTAFPVTVTACAPWRLAVPPTVVPTVRVVVLSAAAAPSVTVFASAMVTDVKVTAGMVVMTSVVVPLLKVAVSAAREGHPGLFQSPFVCQLTVPVVGPVQT